MLGSSPVASAPNAPGHNNLDVIESHRVRTRRGPAAQAARHVRGMTHLIRPRMVRHAGTAADDDDIERPFPDPSFPWWK